MAELVNGQAVRTYTYGLERISELQTVNNAPAASFYQYDGRGTVRMLTNAAGAVTDAYEYDAFGNLISHAGTTPNAYLYRGERYDTDLGLYYLRARWYNPVSGRFMTRDPYQGSIYDPASLHRYNYARANPVSFVDPSGRDAVEYVQLNAANALKAGFLITLSQRINCQYWAIASTVGIIGQHIGQHIDGLDTLWHSCDAGLTASGFVKDLLVNSAVAFAFGAAFDYIGGEIGGFFGDAEDGLPQLPTRLARVVDARFVNSPTLGAPGASDVFVTPANDIAGINTSEGLANRLTLLDNAGNLRQGPFAVIQLDTPQSGLASPVFRDSPGFIQGGVTGGGAGGYILPNLPINQLQNVTTEIIP